MILLNSWDSEPGTLFPELLEEESGVGFILLINLHLFTGNFFCRWSEELKKLLTAKINWVF